MPKGNDLTIRLTIWAFSNHGIEVVGRGTAVLQDFHVIPETTKAPTKLPRLSKWHLQ